MMEVERTLIHACILAAVLSACDGALGGYSEAVSNELASLDAKMTGLDAGIQQEKDAARLIYRRNDKAKCAWEAAKVCARNRLYDRAAGYLDVMRDFGYTWEKENGEKKGKLTRKFIAQSNDVPVAIEFAQGFWVDNPPALGIYHAEARQVVVDGMASATNPAGRLSLHRLAMQYSMALGDVTNAVTYGDAICLENAGNAGLCEQTLLEVARFLCGAGQLRQSRATYGRVLASRPEGPMSGAAHLGLADLCAAEKDDTGMLKHLEMAAGKPAVDTRRNLMDGDNTRQVAIVRLAQYHMTKKSHDVALNYLRQWSPSSWCGNCGEQFRYERDLMIAQCQVALGREDVALRENLMPYLATNSAGMFYSDAKIPELAVRLHEGKKELDRLAKVLAPYAGKKNPLAATALMLTQIRIERQDGKMDELIARLRHRGSFVPTIRDTFDNYESPAAAKALSEFGGREFPALKKCFSGLVEQKKRDDEIYGRRIWVLYAIGLSKAPEAGEYLAELLKSAGNDPFTTIGVGIDDIRHAAALHSSQVTPK